MNAVETRVGRCDTCGESAAYAQLLAGGRRFLYCETHVPITVKRAVEAKKKAAARNAGR